MTRVEAEWLVAYALFAKGIIKEHVVRNETLLPLGKYTLMKTCKKCGGLYYFDCVNCYFRNGSDVVEDRADKDDACTDMADLRYWTIRNRLAWMRVQVPNWEDWD